jgi:acyl-CoA synthetase (AMP-forming)/AMP-acid ligase II
MSGYFGNPKETDRVLWTDEHGVKWLRTGDVARYDADGFFYICDRKKDMIIRSGMKVYPAKVEAALKKHEAVADVAVIGKPDAVHTELVVAYIVRRRPMVCRAGLTDELRALPATPGPMKFRRRLNSSIRFPFGARESAQRDLRKRRRPRASPEVNEKETA